MENKFEVLTPRESVLRRPQMYLGSMDPVEKDMFVVSDDKITYQTITFIPALRKIIDEIIDNSLDAIVAKHNSTGVIKVEIVDDYVIVDDDGPGIPVIKKELSEAELASLPKSEAKELSNAYIPYIAWTRPFSGSNFQDFDEKTSIGSHGLGSKCASIFSTKFIGKTDDGNASCTVIAENNLSKSKFRVSTTSGKSGTNVKFWPDLEKFKLEKIEQVYKDLVYQRLLCLAVSFPNIKFYFNKQQIKINDKKFMALFSENAMFKSFSNGFIGVFPNEFDDFKYLTYVNGLYFSRGGNHIDYISNQIVAPIREKLEKTYKTIKPADIKNKISLVVFFRNFPNMKYDSQTKETLTNSPAEITKFLDGQIDFEKFNKEILKNNAIIDPIVDIFKLKQELKTKKELDKVKKVKVKSDKYMPPIGKEKKYLALCEGLSARSGISASLGRDGIGYYAMRGLPLNAYSSSMQKIVANEELKDIINILSLDISDKSTNKTIDFDKILITSDNDADGSHITAMLIGWFKRFAPELFAEGKVCKLITPLIILVDNQDKIKEYFFDVDSFKSWEAKNTNNKLKIIYLKGLGSWDKEQLIYLINTYGLNKFIQEYKLDSTSDKYIEDWLGNDSEPRKEYLRNYAFDINNV